MDISGLSVSGLSVGSIEGAGSYILGSKSLTVGGNNLSTTVSGPITGDSGSLIKTGTGTLTLSGANTYTGGTTLNGGSLGVGGNSALGAGGLAMADGTTLQAAANGLSLGNAISLAGTGTVDTQANTFTLAGVISGTGGLTKEGSGTLTLTGTNTYTGATMVNAGTLAIGLDATPNASLAGSVTLNGGVVQGFGAIGGNLTNLGGTVAPGGSIGTLTVKGNYTQGANAGLRIEVSPSAASQLAVSGKAALGGALALVYDPGVYTARNYTILTATGVSGTFSTVTGQVPTTGLSQAVAYNSTNVQLQLTGPTTPTLEAAPSPAPIIVVAPTNDTIYRAQTSMIVLNGQRANGILLDRLGSRRAGIADGPVAANGASVATTRMAANGNLAAIGQIAGALPEALAAEGAWFRGIGGFASVDGSGTAPGFTGTAGGFMAGIDRPVAPDLYLGLAGGYLHSDVDEHSTSSGTLDSARVAAYGGGWWGANLFTGTAGYAHDWIASTRGLAGIGNARQSHGGDEVTLAGQWSLPTPVAGIAGSAVVTPKLGSSSCTSPKTASPKTAPAASACPRAGMTPTVSSPISGWRPPRPSSPQTVRKSPRKYGSAMPTSWPAVRGS